MIRSPSGRYLHHNFVVALLNDLFGIQSRGGCSCAGPYGHQLLGIDLDQSNRFADQIAAGCEGIKPGWIRVNLNYFLSEPVLDYLIAAVSFVARNGHRFLADYRFDIATALWKHRAGPVEPPLRLNQLRYSDDGVLTYPRHDTTAPESDLAGYLTEAEAFAATRREQPGQDVSAQVSGDFDELRWFDLPASCLEP